MFPPSRDWDRTTVDEGESWSAQAKILPYTEEIVAFNDINFSKGSEEVLLPDGGELVQTIRIATYICPSEQNDTMKLEDGQPDSYPHNYGMNLGPWLVYDPAGNSGGPGSFFPNARLRPPQFTDGLSKTLMAAEVKAYTAYLSGAAIAAVPPVPTDRAAIGPLGGTAVMGPSLMDNPGHTEWGEGSAHQTGFTTTFTPNTLVPFTSGGQAYRHGFHEHGRRGLADHSDLRGRHRPQLSSGIGERGVHGWFDSFDPGHDRPESVASAIDAGRGRDAAERFLIASREASLADFRRAALLQVAPASGR